MMDGVTRIPVACTLTADDAAARVDEWRAFMAGRVEAAERSELAVRLRLRPDDETLTIAADLAAREKECCAFFAFTIEIEPGARWLRIEAPADAQAVLDGLVAVAHGGASRAAPRRRPVTPRRGAPRDP